MFNKIVAIGLLGRDPQAKQTKSGATFITFSLAVDSGFGQNKKTEWFNVSVFGKTAEIAQKFLHKGSCVCVSGSLSTREYEAKDGKNKTSLEISADSVNFVGRDKPNSSSQPQQVDNASDSVLPLETDGIPF